MPSGGALLRDTPASVALPAVVRLQAALQNGKLHGKVEFDQLDPITWSEMVALIDVLCGEWRTYSNGACCSDRQIPGNSSLNRLIRSSLRMT